jgi:hypothetical protein
MVEPIADWNQTKEGLLMSRKVMRMGRRLLAIPLMLALAGGPLYADPCDEGCCQRCNCPPPYRHCMERPPRIKFKCACPKPVCPPCELEHWGYYETCWRPWPFPPDWTHCPVPPPSAHLEAQGFPGMSMPPEPSGMPGLDNGDSGIRPNQQLPTPRRIGGL